jgi:hypothetical protein
LATTAKPKRFLEGMAESNLLQLSSKKLQYALAGLPYSCPEGGGQISSAFKGKGPSLPGGLLSACSAPRGRGLFAGDVSSLTN